jgi:hypothetical protein
MNRIMFVVGILITITSALLLFFVGTEKLGGSIIVISIIGILLIGASKFRILKT